MRPLYIMLYFDQRRKIDTSNIGFNTKFFSVFFNKMVKILCDFLFTSQQKSFRWTSQVRFTFNWKPYFIVTPI